MKRCLVALLMLAGCAPDPMIGSYAFTISGLDTQTAPSSSTSTPSGSGTLCITRGKADAYLVTIAHSDVGGCTLRGTKKKAEQSMTFDLVANQPCVLRNGNSSVTATISTGTMSQTITKVSESEQRRDVSLAITYTYTGSTIFVNFAGNGNRTYAGPEL
jgi:hypothetical protein